MCTRTCKILLQAERRRSGIIKICKAHEAQKPSETQKQKNAITVFLYEKKSTTEHVTWAEQGQKPILLVQPNDTAVQK